MLSIESQAAESRRVGDVCGCEPAVEEPSGRRAGLAPAGVGAAPDRASRTRCDLMAPAPAGRSGPPTIEGMKVNRSIPSATVIPVLTYPDVRAAVAG